MRVTKPIARKGRVSDQKGRVGIMARPVAAKPNPQMNKKAASKTAFFGIGRARRGGGGLGSNLGLLGGVIKKTNTTISD